jgi:hypothetical protein
MKRFRNSWIYALPALCLLLTGCTQEIVDGKKLTIKFELWVIIALVLVGLALLVAGFFVRQSSSKYGWIMMILGPVVAFLIAPGMYNDYVIIDDDHFELNTGFWFAPTQHNVQFSKVNEIEIKSERTGKRTSTYMYCKMNNGTIEKVPVGTLMKESAMNQILERMKKNGFEEGNKANR